MNHLVRCMASRLPPALIVGMKLSLQSTSLFTSRVCQCAYHVALTIDIKNYRWNKYGNSINQFTTSRMRCGRLYRHWPIDLSAFSITRRRSTLESTPSIEYSQLITPPQWNACACWPADLSLSPSGLSLRSAGILGVNRLCTDGGMLRTSVKPARPRYRIYCWQQMRFPSSGPAVAVEEVAEITGRGALEGS